MSTDPASGLQTPNVSQKGKKTKESANDSMKKRKREQEVQQGDEETTGASEPSKKKSKKSESKGKRESFDQATGGAVKLEDADQIDVKSASIDVTDSNATKREGDAQDNVADVAKFSKKKKKPRKPKATVEPVAGESAPAQKSNVKLESSTRPSQTKSKPAVVADSETERLYAHSPFVQETTSFYLALSPCAYDFPLEGLCAEHISPLLLTYYPPLKGVVLSYSNLRMSEHPDASNASQARSNKEAKTVLSKSIDEYAVTYVWLTAEFTIFRPRRGTYLEGHVNLQNESILGLVCYNYFNAGIERSRLPQDWQWVGGESGSAVGRKDLSSEDEGHFVDGSGKQVEGKLVFKVQDFEAIAGSEGNVGSINIHGTLLSNEEDRRLDDDERQRGLVRSVKR